MAKRSSGGSIRLRGAAAVLLIETLARMGDAPRPRSCRHCGCTDSRACRGGCSWTGETLCSACTPDAKETHAALSTIPSAGHITQRQVEGWDTDQRADAYAWAMAVHQKLWDKPDVAIPPRPSFTLPDGAEVTHG